MTKAIWNNVTIAESKNVQTVEGHVYFPPETVHMNLLRMRDNHTVCSWKGIASYYDVVAGDLVNPNAAWTYPATKPEASHIQGHIAFWNGVTIQKTE